MLAAIDVGALLKVIAASLVAGVAVTTLFSIAILAMTRSAERRRGGDHVAAGTLGLIGVVGLLAVAVVVGLGLQIMVTK